MARLCPRCRAAHFRPDPNRQWECPGCGWTPRRNDEVDLETVDVAETETDEELAARHAERLSEWRVGMNDRTKASCGDRSCGDPECASCFPDSWWKRDCPRDHCDGGYIRESFLDENGDEVNIMELCLTCNGAGFVDVRDRDKEHLR